MTDGGSVMTTDRLTLGVDPSFNRTGWALLSREEGSIPSMVARGIITPSGISRSQRLATIQQQFKEVLSRWSPGEQPKSCAFSITTSTSKTAPTSTRRQVSMVPTAVALLPAMATVSSVWELAAAKNSKGDGRAARHTAANARLNTRGLNPMSTGSRFHWTSPTGRGFTLRPSKATHS